MHYLLKPAVVICFVALFVFACKKDAGKHCPLMQSSNGNPGPLTDLSTISWVPALTDTLAKYPELQALSTHIDPVYGDSTKYIAHLYCNIYYKNILVIDHNYVLYASNSPAIGIVASDTLPLKINPLSVEPAITAAKAIAIATKEINFAHCPAATLCLRKRHDSSSYYDYLLVWLVSTPETGYPEVELDANTGQVYGSINVN